MATKKTKSKKVSASQISAVMREMGRRGGQKGGLATGVRKGFAAMSPERRAEISEKAAAKRWAKKKGKK
jgi:hypothetical protein